MTLKSRKIILLSIIFLLIGLIAYALEAHVDRKELLQAVKPLKVRFAPLPEVAQNPNNPITEAKVHLGKMLYMDPRLSKNHDVSCNSCHHLDKFGVDGLPTSPGHRGQLGERNSPTVYNSALQFKQFWDGRAEDVEEQALGPILNPIEMAMPDEDQVLKVLNSIPEYQKSFRKAFPNEKQPLTYKNVGRAIAAFERTLITPSRFDRFLNGDDYALTDLELEGLNTFATVGCTTCHNNVGIGGNSFQKLGLVKPFKTKDMGRFQVTKVEADKFLFKPPSLRNVAKTGPYFHDGSVKNLEEAIKLMGKHQLGIKLKKNQIKAIRAFLNSLTGEIPEYALKPIDLPASTADTPKPDPT